MAYPRLMPATGNCRLLPRMRPEDRNTFRAINLRVRNEMRAAAHEASVEFVDFYSWSYGHDVCSESPWVQGRLGSSRRGAALHPLPEGQAALARLLQEILREPVARSLGPGKVSPVTRRGSASFGVRPATPLG